VLEAMGVEPPWTHSAVLFTLSWTTTDEEIESAAAAFRLAVARLRAMSPVGP
jgi:cysteine sulfinate desulfinase/cysteine desulfurase-like protein